MYRKNVAGQHVPFLLVNATTGAALTGATVTAYRCIDGAAQAAVTGSVTEKANGQYDFAPSQADMNGNQVGFLFTAASAIPVHVTISTTAADPTDTVRYGLTALPNAVAGANGGLPTGNASGQVAVGSYASGQAPLQPTTAGRTLDVSVGGEAGMDWANVGSPTTVLALTNTTVGTITTYTGDTPQTGDAYARIGLAGAGLTALGDTRVANLDAAVSSRMATYTQPTGFLAATFPLTIASTTNITAGTITTVTTTTTATNLTNAPTSGDFTTAMKTSLNSATPASITGAVGSVTGSVGGNVTGSVGSVASGGITAASLAADTITAAKIATDAGTEIAGAVWDLTTSGHTTSGTFGASLNAAGSAGDPWATSLPGAYGAGTAGHLLGTSLPDVTAGSAGGLFVAGTNAATTVTTAFTANVVGNVTGSLSGSVGSVSGVTFPSNFATLVIDAGGRVSTDRAAGHSVR